MSNSEDNKLAVFQGKHIRKIFLEGEWWFSTIDVIEVLVGGGRPRKYRDVRAQQKGAASSAPTNYEFKII